MSDDTQQPDTHAPADDWNADHPVGTPVYAWPGVMDDRPLVTVTRSAAWVLPAGDAVVMVDGYAGGIALTHVLPAPAERATHDTTLAQVRALCCGDWANSHHVSGYAVVRVLDIEAALAGTTAPTGHDAQPTQDDPQPDEREAELHGPGWFWTRTEWAEWSNELAMLFDEDEAHGNPDGAQESVILATFTAWAEERRRTPQPRTDTDLRERVEALLDWHVGRTTAGVDRLIPSSDLRAVLAETAAKRCDRCGFVKTKSVYGVSLPLEEGL